MKKLLKEQNGIAHLGLFALIIFVLVGIGGVGYYVYQRNQDDQFLNSGIDVDNDSDNKGNESDVEPGSEESKPENQ